MIQKKNHMKNMLNQINILENIFNKKRKQLIKRNKFIHNIKSTYLINNFKKNKMNLKFLFL